MNSLQCQQVQHTLIALAILDMTESSNPDAPLFRRFAALVYDGLLLIAILFVASLLTLPFTGGQGSTRFNPILSAYFLLVTFLFFAWFWTHGGQTLGMRAWKIRLVSKTLSNVSWQAAAIRFAASLPVWIFLIYSVLSHSERVGIQTRLSEVPGWILYGIFIVWLLIDNIPGNWREKISATRVVQSTSGSVSTTPDQ